VRELPWLGLAALRPRVRQVALRAPQQVRAVLAPRRRLA
jgi:hypothetical protein